MSRRKKFVLVGIATALVAAVAGGASLVTLGTADCRLRSVDESEWVEANEQVLSTVPVFEGATKLNEYSIGNPASDACLPFENSAPYDAFWTYKTYTVPPDVSDNDVLDFYDERLTRWVPVTIRTAEIPTCDVSYRRGRALLGVTACNGTLRLGVNHAAYP